MSNSDIPAEKPLYSYVVATPSAIYKESQFKFPSSCSPDIEINNSKEEQKNSPLSHLGNEKFKIDRRKLEKMMETSTNTLGINNAEYFFKNIMKTTDTFITWQRNLKIGARTRKHPFVNIVGKPNDIAWAKGLILASLATRGPLLKMKMIISDVDYPHMLGRTESFKSIMEDTDTLIHFPEANNRSQVSIYGTLEGLEQARMALRSSTPLLMSFELPIGMSLPKHNTQYIKQLEQYFNVKIIFMSIPKNNAFFAMVKGTEGCVGNLKDAIRLLVDATCGTRAAATMQNINAEISKQLFELSMSAENSVTLKELMEKTQTLISVPSDDSNENGLGQRTQITITGSMEGVYEAWKELMSQLPIELTFDIDENPYYTAEILSLGMKYGVSLSMQHNTKDNSETVNMKAAEKIISHIYEANEEIMDMQNTSDDEAELPKAYFKALESNSNCDLSQYEDISRKIWTPIELPTNCVGNKKSSDWTVVSSDNNSQHMDGGFEW